MWGNLFTVLLGGAGAALADGASNDPVIAGVGGVAGVALGLAMKVGQALIKSLEADRKWKAESTRAMRGIDASLRAIRSHMGIAELANDGDRPLEEDETP
jgi:hypothetical protein